jgi:hypothetical protein
MLLNFCVTNDHGTTHPSPGHLSTLPVFSGVRVLHTNVTFKIKKLNAKDLSQTSVEEALGDTKGVIRIRP